MSTSSPTAAGRGPVSRLRVAGIVVLVLAVVLIGGAVVGLVTTVVPGFRQSLSAEPMTPPVDTTQQLGSGPWVVFEQVDAGTVGPEQVTVEGPTGTAVPVEAMTSSQTLTIDGTVYAGAARFVVPADGSYRVAVAAGEGQGTARVLLARDVGSLAGSAIGVVGALVVGVLALVTGIVLTVLGRRRQPVGAATGPTGPTGPTAYARQDAGGYRPPPPPPGPPAGWYPDPGQPGRLRWWDGTAWHPAAPPDDRR